MANRLLSYCIHAPPRASPRVPPVSLDLAQRPDETDALHPSLAWRGGQAPFAIALRTSRQWRILTPLSFCAQRVGFAPTTWKVIQSSPPH